MLPEPHYAPEVVEALARRHGFKGDVRPMARLGIVNDIWGIGDSAVLRVPIDEEAERDTLTEVVAVPAARAAGVLTPELLVFDDTRKVVPFAYTIYERAPGVTLGTQGPSPMWEGAMRQIGEQQRLIHAISQVDDPHDWLDRSEPSDVDATLAAVRHLLSPGDLERLSVWRARFEQIPNLGGIPTFIHWDLHPWNVLVDPDSMRLTAILDWGDAGFHDSAEDFGYFPLWALAHQLAGYGAPDDSLFYGRIARLWVQKCLEELEDLDAVTFGRAWWCFPLGGFEEAATQARSMRGFRQWLE